MKVLAITIYTVKKDQLKSFLHFLEETMFEQSKTHKVFGLGIGINHETNEVSGYGYYPSLEHARGNQQTFAKNQEKIMHFVEKPPVRHLFEVHKEIG